MVARSGNQVHAYWRDSGPSFTWHGPTVAETGI